LQAIEIVRSFFIRKLNETLKRIRNIIEKKKQSASGISPKDKRGHQTPGNELSETPVNLVKEHIRSFSRYTSHYSRHQTPDRKYLNTDLNIRKLYVLYTEFCVQLAKESFYDIFAVPPLI
jgi:hypothetical protein